MNPDHGVVAVNLEEPRARDITRQLALERWRHQVVAARRDHSDRRLDIGDPRPAVEAGHLAAGFGDRPGIVALQLADDPIHDLVAGRLAVAPEDADPEAAL